MIDLQNGFGKRRARPVTAKRNGAGPMHKRTIIQNLEHAREWLDKRLSKPSTVGDPWEAENILVGCLQLMDQCGRRSLGEWLDRKTGRRQALRNVRDRYNVKSGHRALCDLVDLTVSDLEACNWQPGFLIDPLPLKVQPQRPRSEAHKQKLKESSARTRRRRESASKSRLA
jgi:hypothetical protein